MAPMSNGKKSFDSSTNIVEKNKGNGDFYAKKYMFSIENHVDSKYVVTCHTLRNTRF